MRDKGTSGIGGAAKHTRPAAATPNRYPGRFVYLAFASAFIRSSSADKLGYSKNNGDSTPLPEIPATNYADHPGCHCLYTFTAFD